jgi:ABC-type Zn2+ transport system substrate-binding protein/surface adhesin
MLIVMCAAVFKVASWVGPKVDTFLAAHIRQMEQLAEAEVRQTQILRDSMALMKEANVIGRRIEDSAKANGRVLKENQELIRNVLNGTKP